jgi:diacylglycerol kinase (ATP)
MPEWIGGAMTEPRFNFADRLKSFRYAFTGLGFMLKTQHNAWVHLAITLVVVGAGLWLGISAVDWRWLIVAIALVWVAETTNTAFEFLCDAVVPNFHTSVEKAKDIAAAAVLICAAAAAIIGVLVFWPYL